MRKLFIGAAVAALVVACLAGWKFTRPTAVVWEYKNVMLSTVSSDSASDSAAKYETLQSELNALGKEGWELATIVSDMAPDMSAEEYEMITIHRFFLKRPASQ